MANQTRSRSNRQPATPQNSQIMGVVLVVAGFLVALLLLIGGGGTDDKAAGDGGDTSTDGTSPDTEETTTTAAPVTTPPANLVITVGNGSGVSGRAKKTAELLVSKGYPNSTAVDGVPTQTTQFYFIPGATDDAKAVAATLGFGADRVLPLPAPVPLKNPDIGGARVVVLVGPDFDPAAAPAAQPAPSA